MARFFSRKVRRALDDRANGCCERLYGFGCGAPLSPGKWAYDHIVRYELTHDSTLENGQILCDNCHAAKTYICDTPDAAKGKRVRDKHAGGRPPARRHFPCSRSTSRKRKFGGGTAPRLTLAEKMSDLREKLGGVYLQPEDTQS